MKKILIISCLICFSITSFAQNNLKTLDFGEFKLKVPLEWYSIRFKCIDSYVGGFTNGKDTLIFDLFVDYNNFFNYIYKGRINGYWNFENCKSMLVFFHGNFHSISIANDTSKNASGILYNIFLSKVHFFMYGENLSTETKKILKDIFKSIEFPKEYKMEFYNFYDKYTERIAYYKNGKRHGKYIEYCDSKGNIYEEGEYYKGKKNGTWMTYDCNGKIEKTETYINGKLIHVNIIK